MREEEKQKSYDIQSILKEMRSEYWRGLEEAEETKVAETGDYVVIRLGGERYGLPSTATREVLRIPRLVKVPRVGEHIHGVINLRGQILAVTDLRPLFGLPQGDISAEGRLVVVEAAGILTALATEQVEGIRSIDIDQVEPFTEGLANFPRSTVSGQLIDEEGALILLDLEQILSRPEFIIDQKGE